MTMIENLEPTALIWLAALKDRFDANYQKEFRKSINWLVTFTDTNECENYIQKCSSNGTQVVLIIDKQFIHDFLPRVHDIRQVSSIYIITEDKEELEIEFSKVSGNTSE